MAASLRKTTQVMLLVLLMQWVCHSFLGSRLGVSVAYGIVAFFFMGHCIWRLYGPLA